MLLSHAETNAHPLKNDHTILSKRGTHIIAIHVEMKPLPLPSLGPLLLTGLLLGPPIEAQAAPPAEEDVGEDVIDPDEVVEDEEDLDRKLIEEANNPESLCIIRLADDVSKIAFITYARHEMWRACFGADRISTTHGQFFHVVGREDLRERQGSRNTLKTAITIGQFSIFAGGVALTAVGLVEKDLGFFAVGASIAIGSFFIDIVNNAIPPNTTSMSEAIQLAEEYNSMKGAPPNAVHAFQDEGTSHYFPILSGTF